MTGDLVTRKYLVSGRVQGVGYRVFAARSGRSLGLSGGASNLDDGRVLVIARGPAELLDRLEGFLWEGPRLSRVSRVEVSTVEGDAGDDYLDVEF